MVVISLPAGYRYVGLPGEFEYMCENILYQKALRRCYNKKFFGWIQDRLKHGANVILSITGFTGSGKSMTGLRIAEKYMNFNDVENLQFDNTALLGRIQKIFHFIDPKKDVLKQVFEYIKKHGVVTFIKDEQRGIEAYGIGARREIDALASIEEIVRKFQVNFIYISPELRLHEHHYYLKVIARNDKLMRNLAIVHSADGIPLGYIEVGFPENKKMVEAYEERKAKFIASNLNLNFITRYETYINIAEELVKNKEFMSLPRREKRTYLLLRYGSLFAKTEIDEIINATQLLEEGIDIRKEV